MQIKQTYTAGVLPLLGEVRRGGFIGDAVFSARVMLGINPLIGNASFNKSTPDIGNAILASSSVNVYPNPANNTLYIELDAISEESAIIDIYDLNGRLCYHTSINCMQKLQTINVSSITKGIYNLQIKTTTQTKNQKLVIIK
ncbi:MAG: T9SS type A sorting domain-containing protein [Bacteroidales bacterium]